MRKLKLLNKSEGSAQNASKREVVRGRNDNLKIIIDSFEITRFWSVYIF